MCSHRPLFNYGACSLYLQAWELFYSIFPVSVKGVKESERASGEKGGEKALEPTACSWPLFSATEKLLRELKLQGAQVGRAPRPKGSG